MKCEKLTNILFESIILRDLSQREMGKAKAHLDSCRSCWTNWNNFRWNKSIGGQGYRELIEFLGPDFEWYIDSSWELANEWNKRKPDTKAEIEQFYKEVPYYIYNLLIWEESGNRLPYVKLALGFLKSNNCNIIVDFGCGIGNDGLLLIEHGFEVIFCDFDNLATKFLKWRLQKRGINARFIEPNGFSKEQINFDTFWAMDVIEHLPKPEETLRPYLERAQFAIYAADFDDRSNQRQPFHFLYSRKRIAKLFKSCGFTFYTTIVQLHCWTK